MLNLNGTETSICAWFRVFGIGGKGEALSIEATAASSRALCPELTLTSQEITRPSASTTKFTIVVPETRERGLILARSRRERSAPRYADRAVVSPPKRALPEL